MKSQNLLTALYVLGCYLVGGSSAKAGDISLEQILGIYSSQYSSGFETRSGDLTLRLEANRLFCFDSSANAFRATYKNQVLFIDFDKGLLKLDERNLPESGLYLPIRWGERIYLIHKINIPGFCDAINAGIEPHAHWDRYNYYLRGGWARTVTGDPELPAEYKSLLLNKPVNGKVIELAEKGTAWVDLGSDSNVRPKMTLMSHWMPDQSPRIKRMPGMIEPRTDLITVLKVEKDRCLIEGPFTTMEIGTSITARRWD